MLWHEVISDFTLTSFTKTGDMGEVGGPLSRVVTLTQRSSQIKRLRPSSPS